MEIKKLDSNVISKIRSSVNISSVAQCVFELVCNSLDAKSTSIAVRVNLVTFKIQVADNGEGITKENFDLLGVRHATSKCHTLKDFERNIKTYGFRGEVIASILEMCKSVSISSKFKTSSDTYSKVLSKDFTSQVKLTKHRPSAGTTVTVLGWFSTIPVRQQRIVPEIELEEVKKQLESLVLINPGTSFTLRNDVTGLLILNSPKNPDIVNSLRHLHPEINEDSFTLLKVTKNKVSIKMLIQKELGLSKELQYVYVNKIPVRSSRILRYVHNACFRTFKPKTIGIGNKKTYPVYVMNIKCPKSYVDNLSGPSKTEVEFTCWNLVLACIDKIIKTIFGLESTKHNIPIQSKVSEKLSFGVSQLCGAVQASAFKRKSDDNISEESISKIRRTDIKEHNKEFTRDKTTLQSSEMSGNYQIEDSGKHQPVKVVKIKSIIKKPLAIQVKPISRMEVLDKRTFSNDGDVGNFSGNHQNDFDQCSVYSRLNNDEDQGKDLIMDMFLKSTQVFKAENKDAAQEPGTDAELSKETIEESNFMFENAIQDTVKGINTTMSISINVKKRRIKNLASKYAQTSGFDGKCASKCVQTSQVSQAHNWNYLGLPRHSFYPERVDPIPVEDEVNSNISDQHVCIQSDNCKELAASKQGFKEVMVDLITPQLGLHDKERFHKDSDRKTVDFNNKPRWTRHQSYQTDLANRFDGFTLECSNNEDVKADYTILINTVHKKREYMFVRKSEEMEVDDSEESPEFRPLKICYCGKDERNIFGFRKKEGVRNVEGGIGYQQPLLERTSQEIIEKVNEFKKPDNPVLKYKPKNHLIPQDVSMNNLLFRGMTKHPPAKMQTKALGGESPYFSKIREANINQSLFGKFQPMFKSTQFAENDLKEAPRNHVYTTADINVVSPFFKTNNYNKHFQPITSNVCKLKSNNKLLHPIENYNNFGLGCDKNLRNGNITSKLCCSRCPNYNQNQNVYFKPHLVADDRVTNYIASKNNFCKCGKENIHEDRRNIDLNATEHFYGNPCLNKLKMAHHYKNHNHRIKECFENGNDAPTEHNLQTERTNWPERVHDFDKCEKENVRDRRSMDLNAMEHFYGNSDLNKLKMAYRYENHHHRIKEHNLQPERTNWPERIHDSVFNQNNHMVDQDNLQKIHFVNNLKTTNNIYSCHENILPKHYHNSEHNNCHENDYLETLNDKEDLSDEPPWNTPVVSNYFEPSIQENVNVKDKQPNEKMFDFKLSNSPNIFSDNVVKVSQNVNYDTRKKDFEELNTLCDLADFGLVSSKNHPLTEAGSKLEISLPSDEDRQKIVANEIANINNFVSYESDLKVVEDEGNQNETSKIIIDSQNHWLRQRNESGRKFFVNTRTGMVSAKTPNLQQIKFDFDKRLDFVPKGMSPVLKEHQKVDKTLSQKAKTNLHDLILEGYNNELMVVKWQNFTGDDPKAFFEKIYRDKTKQFETCIPSVHESNLKIPKDYVSFSGKMFESIQIIGQIDKKFIAILEKTKNLLILLDQHAVHERIRVERFLKEYQGIKTVYEQKLTIFLPSNDLSLLKKHAAYVESLGLGVEFFTNGLHVTDVPLCIKEKYSSEINSEDLNNVLNMLIKDTVEFLKVTRGSTVSKPKIIQDIINLKSCRGAIKFGDVLSTEECRNLVNDLSKCKLPFQCAHGRPTLVPILSLNKVRAQIKRKQVDLKKLLIRTF